MRADARRNRERILAEARAALAAHGTDTSLEDVAVAAGVGIGTLYRHFPTREALLEEVLKDRFDALALRGRDLADHASPKEALVAWALEFVRTNTTYRGLTALLTATLQDEGSALHASCASMREAGLHLLQRAQEAGEVRGDLDPGEFLVLAFGAAWAHEQRPNPTPESLDRLVTLLFEGLSTP